MELHYELVILGVTQDAMQFKFRSNRCANAYIDALRG